MGMGHRVDEYDFEIEDIFEIEHRERLGNDGLPETVYLNPDIDSEYLKIERILGRKWNCYATNKICFDFLVS